MTDIHITCPWCEQDVEITPADIILTARNRRSRSGVYRWFHCGQLITRRASERIFAVLLGVGCRVELTDDSEIQAFTDWLDEVRTPADMLAGRSWS